MLCLLAAASSSWAYTTDAQTHAVVTADGTTLTAGAQAWIKAYSQAVEQRWSAGGGSAGDITAFKKMLLWRFLPPAGSVLPMAAGTSTQSQVCSPAIQAGCWYYQRDDHGINAGSQGGHFIDWTYYGPPYYGTFPSTNNLDGFTFPDLAQYLYARTQRGARELLEERGVLPSPRKHRNGTKWVFWAEEPEADAKD